MAKQGAKTATPRLRFPEFRDSEGWHLKQLGDLCKIKTGKKDVNEGAADGKYPFFTCAEQHSHSNSYSFDTEAILIAGNANVGLAKYFNGKFEAYQRTYVLTDFSNIDVHYLYAYVAAHLRPSLLSQVQTSAMSYIKLPMLQGYELFVPPSNPEQKKVADCLTSLDEVIAAQGRKVEALKAHKRGLMQQLFPREGETRPRLRFPEFRNAPEWEDRALGPMTVKVGSGITPLGGDKNYKTTGRPFMRSQNVGWGQLLLDDVAFIDEETHTSFDATEIVALDVLLNITGASIGRSAVADSRVAGGNVNQHVCIIRAKPDELNPVLLNQFLISERGQKQIDSFQAGGNRQGLNFAQIRSFEIPLPPTEKEQERIADCLSSLDTQITAESAKHAALKTHKRGLMQQLFPASDAG